MFDWNDEELANIIWDEGGEGDDHIVPFPEASEDLKNKKEVNQEPAVCKLNKRKQPETQTDFDGKLGSSSNLDNNGGQLASGYVANSCSDLSLSSAAKIDQDSPCTELSKYRGELSKLGTSKEITQNGRDAEFYQNADEGKEQGDFADYDWANIGSFDDLDRIFSNDDPIFGHTSLDNSDDLWSAKDVSSNQASVPLNTPSPTDALRNRSGPLEIKEEHVHCSDQSFSLDYEKISGPAYQSIENSHTITNNVECAGDRSKPTGHEQQSFSQKNQLKTRKKSKIKQEGKDLQDFYGNWSSSATSARQFESQLTPSVLQSSPSSILGQPKQLRGPETLYQNIINPYVAPSFYGNLPAMPMLTQFQSGNLRHQHVLSGYETSSGPLSPLKSYAGSAVPQTMTPQEKIEKLRRRQQMQAMLAIQKQQQVLGHQVPCTGKSVAQKCHPQIQSHSSDGTDPKIEDLSTLPLIEQDDSNTISLATDDDFVEETILCRLQDVISKLDVTTRLCIRDSLFRLAQSATQRHYAIDTSSTNKNNKEYDVFAREESSSQNRYARMPDVETETNSIDRTVARLLFHRPVELTGNYSDKLESHISTKDSDKLESHISTKVQCESKAANQVNVPVRCLQEENLRSNQQLSHIGLEDPCPSFEVQPMDQTKNSLSIGTSENESNLQELEASQ